MPQLTLKEKIATAIIIVLAGIFLIIALKPLFSFGVDDSYIFFRYAENLAGGNGFVFNAGEPAGEGFTSWAWVLLLALARLVGLDLILASKLLGTLFHVGSAVMLYFIMVQWRGDSRASRLTGLVIAAGSLLHYRLVAHGLSGMETSLYVFSITLLVYLTTRALNAGPETRDRWWLWLSLATSGLFIVRPEGIVAGGLSLLALFFRQWKDLLKPRVWLYLFAGLIGPVVLLVALKMAIFGYPMPQSYYHKLIVIKSEYGESMRQLLQFLKSYAWLLVLGAIVVAAVFLFKKMTTDRTGGPKPGEPIPPSAIRVHVYYAFLFAGMCAVYLMFYPAMNYLHRFYIPYLPLLLLMIAPGLSALFRKLDPVLEKCALALVLVPVLLSTGLVFALDWDKPVAEKRVASWTSMVDPAVNRGRLGKLMAKLPAETVVANSEMGVIPYFSGLACIDMAGLTDPHISHNGLSMEYLEQRNVDLILFPRDVEAVTPAQWDQYTWNYKGIFLSTTFKRDFQTVGAFDGWPGGRKKYYMYADKTSPRFDAIRAWAEKYAALPGGTANKPH